MKFSRALSKVGKLFGFFGEYAQDLWLFFRHNGHSPFVPAQNRLFYHTVIQTHTVEKGLALSQPRPLFGRQKITEILSMLRRYDRGGSLFPLGMAHGALADYSAFNREQGLADPLLDQIETELGSADPSTRTGGVKFLHRDAPPTSPADLAQFLTSRSSCRMFAPDILSEDIVRRAVTLAQSSPSQCNRQATKAHYYNDPGKIAALLKLQGGSAGFSDSVRNLFVVTSDITAWGGPQQRNQLYVDGGLFSMMLMLAFHSQGIASCPLNLAVTNGVERKIKAEGNIPANERVIMMIAVGHAVDGGLKAAKSPRRPVDEVLLTH